MGVENFKPTIWSAKLFTRLRKAHVYAGLCNQDYSGEITPGGSVKINEIGPISVSSYTMHSDITYAALTSGQKTLMIDQQKYFAFEIDSIERVQSKPDLMNGAMDEAAYAVSDTVDQFIASKYTEAAALDTTNLGTSATAVTIYSSTGNAMTVLSYMSRVLTEKNVPQAGRWVVVPPWFAQKLMIAITGAGSLTAVPKVMPSGVIVDGYIGSYWGFEVFLSNNVAIPTGTTYAIMFGNQSAMSYAGQIAQIEALRHPYRFSDAVRGLYVYGAKVVRPDALGVAYLTEGA